MPASCAVATMAVSFVTETQRMSARHIPRRFGASALRRLDLRLRRHPGRGSPRRLLGRRCRGRAGRPAIAEPTLVARAVLPAATFAAGPSSGSHLGGQAANGQPAPFAEQPVQGFSAVLRSADGSFMDGRQRLRPARELGRLQPARLHRPARLQDRGRRQRRRRGARPHRAEGPEQVGTAPARPATT
jgi:hypothetical protein